MEKLFDDFTRTDKTMPNHHQDEYLFLDRFDSYEVNKIREKLNKWFSNYPEDGQKELKHRLKNSFANAFYELFIHELFRQQGFNLILHPNIPNSFKKPDFLATKGGLEIYIEATVADEYDDNEKRMESKANTLYDSINKANIKCFINIDQLYFKSNYQPRGDLIIRFLEREINKYSEAEIESNFYGDCDDRIRLKYEDKNVTIEFLLFPKPPELIGNKNIRNIAFYPVTTNWGYNDSIGKSIRKKSNKYGEMDKPLIICANAHRSLGLTDNLIAQILLGDFKVNFSSDPTSHRDWDGLLGSPINPKLKRVSGVLITGVNVGNMLDPKHWLVKNPFSKMDFDFDKFLLSFYHFEANRLQFAPKNTIKEVLY